MIKAINKNKLLIIFLALTCLITESLQANIISASHWTDGSKNIFIYNDCHENEISNQKKYITQTIFNMPPRSKPLDIILERIDCYILATLRKATGQKKFEGELLNYLGDFHDRVFKNNLTISTFDNRSINELFILKLSGHKFPQDMETIATTYSLMDVMEHVKTNFNRLLTLHTNNQPIEQCMHALLEKYQDERKKLIKKFMQVCPNSKLNEPILNIMTKNGILNEAFLDLINELKKNLLIPLFDAELLSRVVSKPNDVAIFTGFFHGIILEEHLKALGYNQIALANESQHALAKLYIHCENNNYVVNKKDFEAMLEKINLSLKQSFPHSYTSPREQELKKKAIEMLHNMPTLPTEIFNWML